MDTLLNYATPRLQKRQSFVVEIVIGIVIRMAIFMLVATLICLICSLFT